MKLPNGDNDLTEDEIEGLVSTPSSVTYSPQSFRSARSKAWMNVPLSSRSVGKQKKFLVFLAFLALLAGLVGLTHTDGDSVLIQHNNTVTEPSADHYDVHNSANGIEDAGDDGVEAVENTEKDKSDDTDTPQNESEVGNSSSGKGSKGGKDEKEDSDDDSDEKGTSGDESGNISEGEQGVGDTKGNENSDEKKSDVKEDEETDEKDEENPSKDKEDPSKDEEEEDADAEAKKEALIEKWGKWHFWDGDPDSRPKEDYMAKYPNRDCTFNDFPETAWQGDAVYVNHMLDSASELVRRAKEAIYTEYGYGPKDEISRDQLKERMKMFRLHMIDLDDDSVTEDREYLESGGWTTKKSFDGLSRRLIHAMMTNDSFTIVLGGHSAAAGHGNHFKQSYMMQMYKVLNPVFERVGVKLIVRNLAQGGLGTLQHTLGSKDIYGDEIDMIVWDSSMTENDHKMIDLFYRQALIGGKRPPVLWGGPFKLLKDLYLHADADVFVPGSSLSGIKETTDEEQAATMPFAARFLKCEKNSQALCDSISNKFRGQCWIDRDDVTVTTKQGTRLPSQVKWHPGFRTHQLRGRSMAMNILTALEDAIDTWSEITIVEGHPLGDSFWHVTEFYDNIRSKALKLDSSVGACNQIKEFYPERICTTPMSGRTEFTPRANPDETSLRSILKPTKDGFVPTLEAKMLYDGPDVPNPLLMSPDGEIDVEAIVSNRRGLLSEIRLVGDADAVSAPLETELAVATNQSRYIRGRRLESIEVGKGWQVRGYPGNCDGTYTGICNRMESESCLLYGHMDYRGGILGNEFSGWLVFNVPKVTAGLIIFKFEEWHLARESTVTEGWKSVNNERFLKEEAKPLPDNFELDYAIDGKITTLNLEQFREQTKHPERVVTTLTLLDDPDMKESKDMEVAFRLRNCGRDCAWLITHLYWA